MGQHHASGPPERGFEARIIVQLTLQELAERGGRAVRIGVERRLEGLPVDRAHRLIEHHVEADRRHARVGEAIDQVGDARSRPRPASHLGEAGLVDGDDDHVRPRRDRPAGEMPEVEQLPIEDFDGDGGEQPQARDDHRDRGADRRHPDATKHRRRSGPESHRPGPMGGGGGGGFGPRGLKGG